MGDDGLAGQMILYSPAEPIGMVGELKQRARKLRIDVEPAARVEAAGCDFLWRHHMQWYGVQRKQLDDFVASLNDGRLTKELGQMKAAVELPVIVIEGKIRFINGVLASVNGYSTREIKEDGWQRRILSLMHLGVHVQYTADRADTARWVCAYFQWSERTDHHTATTRPMPKDEWGTVNNEDFQIHLLTALPAIGPMLAKRIIQVIGMPLRLDATVADLMTVPGVGKKLAGQIVRVFHKLGVEDV